MKYGNHSQINLIAEEVGGAVGTAPPEAQIELFDVLLEGGKEAVSVGSLDPKVCAKVCIVFECLFAIFQVLEV